MKRLDVFAMVGAIFAFVGGILTIVGVVMGLNMDSLVVEGDMSEGAFVALFVGMGLLTFGIGVVLLIRHFMNSARNHRLVREGRYIWATVVDVYMDWSVRVNHKPTYRVMLREGDFGSREFFAGPFPVSDELSMMGGKQVKVYIDVKSDDYFVDLSSCKDRNAW